MSRSYESGVPWEPIVGGAWSAYVLTVSVSVGVELLLLCRYASLCAECHAWPAVSPRDNSLLRPYWPFIPRRRNATC